MNWSYVSVEPTTDADRETLVGLFETSTAFGYDAEHDGELVFAGATGPRRARELLRDAVDHVERATVVSTHDDTHLARAQYFESRAGDLVAVDEATSWQLPAAVDLIALEHGVHGPA